LNKPPLRLAIEFNKRVRGDDEWFDDPDDLDRVERALASIDDLENPLAAAGVLAFRVTRVPGFAEGNKRTALLLARWLLDHNGVDGGQILPQDDRVIADLLVRTASEPTQKRRSFRILRHAPEAPTRDRLKRPLQPGPPQKNQLELESERHLVVG